MDSVNILSQMAHFDFNKPVDVEVTIMNDNDGKNKIFVDLLLTQNTKNVPDRNKDIEHIQVKAQNVEKISYNNEKSLSVDTNTKKNEHGSPSSSLLLHRTIDSVSTNLTKIINTSNQCYLLKIFGNFPEHKINAYYVNSKIKLFKLSHCVVLNIILPLSENKNFNEIFVKRTFHIAKTNKINTHIEQIEMLYQEMLEWTTKTNNNTDKISVQTIIANELNPQKRTDSEVKIQKEVNYKEFEFFLNYNDLQQPEIVSYQYQSINTPNDQYVTMSATCNLSEQQFCSNTQSAGCQNLGQTTILTQKTMENLGNANYFEDCSSCLAHSTSATNNDVLFVTQNSNCFLPTIQGNPEKESVSTPITISYATSYNQHVSLIKEGLCTVCSKKTRLKCLNCYGSYYCSETCQAYDWDIHLKSCYAPKIN